MQAEVTAVGTPQAFCTPTAIPLACTPGRSRPVAITVANANVQAYHFWPIAFSM
jgi:hypothetical protein